MPSGRFSLGSFGKVCSAVAALATVAGVVHSFVPSAGPSMTVLGNNYTATSTGQQGGMTVGAIVGSTGGTATQVAQLVQDPGSTVIGKDIQVHAGAGSGSVIGEQVTVGGPTSPGQSVVGEQITVGAPSRGTRSIIGEKIVVEAGPGSTGTVMGKRIVVGQ